MSSLGSPRQSQFTADSADTSARQSKAVELDEKIQPSTLSLPLRDNSLIHSDSNEENDEMDDGDQTELTIKKKLKKKTDLAKQ
jgi:hypothetical protein